MLKWMCSKCQSRLSIDRMQSLAKLHTYYVSNVSLEMNYTFSEFTEEEFFKELNKSFNDITEFSEEDIVEQKKNLIKLRMRMRMRILIKITKNSEKKMN